MVSQTVDAVKDTVDIPTPSRNQCKFDRRRYAGNREPNLSELYDDPVLHALLQRDGLPLATLKDIVSSAQRRLVTQ